MNCCLCTAGNWHVRGICSGDRQTCLVFSRENHGPSPRRARERKGLADASSVSELDCGHSSLSPSHALLLCLAPSLSWGKLRAGWQGSVAVTGETSVERVTGPQRSQRWARHAQALLEGERKSGGAAQPLASCPQGPNPCSGPSRLCGQQADGCLCQDVELVR